MTVAYNDSNAPVITYTTWDIWGFHLNFSRSHSAYKTGAKVRPDSVSVKYFLKYM